YTLTKWCLAVGMLTPSQNAIRAGYHTNDHMLILCCAIDRERELGKPLLLFLADLSNVFLSTDQSTLWLKMRAVWE
ncbi:hypothetical protein B0H19DRAFT_970565, partial [Mycena capillaripes]